MRRMLVGLADRQRVASPRASLRGSGRWRSRIIDWFVLRDTLGQARPRARPVEELDDQLVQVALIEAKSLCGSPDLCLLDDIGRESGTSGK